MAQTTAQQMRAWTGPTLLSYGFRPFFLGAGLWALLAMLIWLLALNGTSLPTHLDPVSWHAHALLYGYLGAVIAGFLLTAVPNWTRRLPIVGWRLGLLAGLWLLGRIVVLFSAHLPLWLVAAIDLSFSILLGAAIAREIIAGKNWRNLIILGMLVVFTLGNGLFHLEAARGDYAAQGVGFRLGLGAALMMIAVVGGRIVPSFTRNWLVKRDDPHLPTPPMQRFDKLALLVLLAALLMWVSLPDDPTTGAALALSGLLHLVRLSRWSGHRTLSDPLVLILHVSYLFLPLGALALGADLLGFGWSGTAAAQHLWMAGAIGLMTMAVMTRATLGHTGNALTAGRGTQAIYTALIGAVLTRLAAGLWPYHASALHSLSGALWLIGFFIFVVIYGQLLLQSPPAKSST